MSSARRLLAAVLFTGQVAAAVPAAVLGGDAQEPATEADVLLTEQVAVAVAVPATAVSRGGRLKEPDMTFQCDLCSGPRKNVCKSTDCMSRCAGKQCYSPFGGPQGCCCDPRRVPSKDNGKCQQAIHNGTCVWSCCLGTDVVPCGGGCCRPSTGGTKTRCGLRLQPQKAGSKRPSTPCCVSSQADPEEQLRKGCCTSGPGLRCDQPGHPACCLWPESAVPWDPDPRVPCQRNCSVYRPCPGPSPAHLGFNCTPRDPRFPMSSGKSRCCMSNNPSVRDPCQSRPEECPAGGRFKPCPAQRGIDCASAEHSVCCMPGPSCRNDCAAYDEERRRQQLFAIAGSGAAAVLLAVLVAVTRYCCWDWLKLCLRRCFPCLARRRTSSEVVINGRGVFVPPWKEPSMRLALVISCSKYVQDYPELPSAESDGEKIAAELERLGYDVTPVPGATRNDILQGFRTVIQKAAGVGVLIVIYFAGHAVEVAADSLYWAGVDAKKDDLTSHVSMAEVMQWLQQVHLRQGQNHFGAKQKLPNAYFVLLAACCREPPQAVVESRHQVESRTREIGLDERPSFFSIFAVEPGARLRDRNSFTEELIAHMGKPLDLNDFCAAVSDGMAGKAERIWHSGNASRDISLAPSITSTASACSEGSSSSSLLASPRAGTGGTLTPRGLRVVPE